MYNDYFGLRETPFSIAPDPRYLYMSEQHREALAHLIYGIGSEGGFVLLSGEVGTGKTTVCRCLLEQIPEDCEVAFVLNPKVNALELLATICDEFKIDRPGATFSSKDLVDRINAFLLELHAHGRRAVLIIDEAQNLSAEVLEQLRLLTNLETNRRKLLQIILLAQPEFNDLLGRPEMRQLAQRITARYHLKPLSRAELDAYLSHRLRVAGLGSLRRELFPGRILRRLHRLSGGIPRLVNLLCDRSLLGAYVREQSVVTPKILRQAAGEVFGESSSSRPARRLLPWWGLGALALVSAGLVFAGVYRHGLAPQLVGTAAPVVQSRAEPPPVPDAEPAALSLDWPQATPHHDNEAAALASLVNLWGLDYSQGRGDACAFAEENGLGCLRDRDSLRTLRFLDRPAVLTLYADSGRPYFAVLVGIVGSQATLQLGDERHVIDLAELQKRWQGEFTLLWRQPPGFQGVVRRGDGGMTVQWLARQLAAFSGEDFPAGATIRFDEELAAQVRRFQLDAGLEPDGLVGTRTLIRLNSLTGPQVPTLDAAGG